MDAETMLPEFELDCRDWIVARPAEAGLPEDDETGAPVLAVLSTVLISDHICEATGSITVGVLDADDDLADLDARPVLPGGPAHEVLDLEPVPGMRRYVVPAPEAASSGPRIALLAEFVVPAGAGAELDRRVDALMGSFRWHAA